MWDHYYFISMTLAEKNLSVDKNLNIISISSNLFPIDDSERLIWQSNLSANFDILMDFLNYITRRSSYFYFRKNA